MYSSFKCPERVILFLTLDGDISILFRFLNLFATVHDALLVAVQ